MFRERPTDYKVKDLKIPKKRFVMIVLQWCEKNLETSKFRYDLKIHYYANKNFGGKFQSHNKQIIIYLHSDLGLEDLVDIVIHEYVHHIQFSMDSTEQDYNKMLVKNGYWNNPFEVEARKLAEQHRRECLIWIHKHNQLF